MKHIAISYPTIKVIDCTAYIVIQDFISETSIHIKGLH